MRGLLGPERGPFQGSSGPSRSAPAYAINGPDAIVTQDEPELLDVPLLAAHGTADCRPLGVQPRPVAGAVDV